MSDSIFNDPRTAKLPKWAQEGLREAECLSALAWPTEAEPVPAFTVEDDTVPRAYRGLFVWVFYGADWSIGNPVIERVEINENGYVQRQGGGSPCRADGAYYASERDAALALWWHKCRTSARAIQHFRTMARAATSPEDRG